MSAVELCATTPLPVSPCSKTTLEPSDASTIVVKRRGMHTFFFLANQMVTQGQSWQIGFCELAQTSEGQCIFKGIQEILSSPHQLELTI